MTEPMESKVDTLARRALGLVQSFRRRIEDHEKTRKARGYGGPTPPLEDITREVLNLESAVLELRGEAPEVQPGYVRRVVEGGPMGPETREFHESFGVIRLSRPMSAGGRNAGMRIFGSSLDFHPIVIELEIMRAERIRGERDNARYWPLNGRDTHIASIRMSHHQFSELIMGANIGSGVPCTLLEVRGTDMEPVPDEVRHEHEEILEDIQKAVAGGDDGDGLLDKAIGEAADILKKNHIGKGDKKRLAELLVRIAEGGKRNLSFYGERFNEAAEKVRGSIRSDIESTINAVMTRIAEKTLALRGQDALDEIAGELPRDGSDGS